MVLGQHKRSEDQELSGMTRFDGSGRQAARLARLASGRAHEQIRAPQCSRARPDANRARRYATPVEPVVSVSSVVSWPLVLLF